MRLRHRLSRHNTTRYILFNARNCQACWKCIKACKNHVIGKVEIGPHKHAHINDPDLCDGCGCCVRVCSNHAILSRVDQKLDSVQV